MTIPTDRRAGGITPAGFALVALALSVGWGIRGNFGHEYGAMIPGALAAIAVAIASGRDDWMRRVAHFGFLGAVGWSFGGGISYMQVIGYTHSGHSDSVVYGFACLSLIGFLWASLGGAFTALPAFLDRGRLTGLYLPALVLLGVWLLQDLAVALWKPPAGDSRHENPLYWFDTDWVGASTAIAAMLLYCLARRHVDFGSSLILHMAAGWWLGFAVLVLALGLRMTPPRGDNWAGHLGMAAGLFVFLVRERLFGVAWVMVVSGAIGGASFAGAATLKLLGMTSGLRTNWHSILEQTYGLLNGLAIAIPMGVAARSESEVFDGEVDRRRWADVVAVTFVLGVLTYVNLVKNVSTWIKDGAFPPFMQGFPASSWFNLFYALIVAAILGMGLRHLRRPLAVLPTTPLGRSQLLFCVLIWWVAVGNFERALTGFREQRLVTEGVIFVNALLCTVLALTLDRPASVAPRSSSRFDARRLAITSFLMAGLVGSLAVGDWRIIRAVYGDRPAPGGSLHIRFGPDATVKPGPVRGAAHP